MTKNSTKQNFLLFMKINLIQLIIAVVFAANAFAIPAKAQDMLQKKVSISLHVAVVANCYSNTVVMKCCL